MTDAEVWYASYGSNMSLDRLACYLRGGRPAGASVTYVGARNRSMPREDIALELPGRLYFAGESRVWGGGTAFYDHDVPGPTPARAYRLTVEQFVDVAAQEMHRLPHPEDPLHDVVHAGLADGLEDGRHEAGDGVYETLLEVDRRDGLPVLTFTAPHGSGSVPHTRPEPAYLDMLAAGLREAHRWDDQRIGAYFASVMAETS